MFPTQFVRSVAGSLTASWLTLVAADFKVAVGLGVTLVFVLTGILLRLYSGWFLALPLIMFGQVPYGNGLQANQRHETRLAENLC